MLNCKVNFIFLFVQLKLKKSRKYNLSDDEEDAMTLNQLLSSGRDDFEEEVPPDDDFDADLDNHGELFLQI